MNALLTLWLPILLSAVVVFVISSLVHMVLKWHSGDYQTLPNEDAIRAAIRAGNPLPGRYVMPHCKDMKEMAGEGMKQKYREGPVGHLTLLPNGMPNMGKYLGQWFVWSLAIAVVAGYLAARIYGVDHSHARSAAKLVGAVCFIAHGFGTITESIWTGRPWSQSVKYLIDAALYALGSAFVFFWLWP
jgi:hypothetical protein